MKKHIAMAVISVMILILIVLVVRPSLKSQVVLSENHDEPVMLGHCPTMSGIAQEVAAKNPHVSLVPYNFTAQALQSLNEGVVDAVLVGRLAEENEIGKAFERQLRGGLTLIGKEKRLISIDELRRSRIHTYVTKEQAEGYIPNIEDAVFHDSLESAVKDGIDDIVLIQWSDFSDEFELIIPVDGNLNKIEMFRIPVLYSYDEYYIKSLEV